MFDFEMPYFDMYRTQRIDDTYIESMVEEHIDDLVKEMENEDGKLD